MPQLAVADFLTENIAAEVSDPSTGKPLWTETHRYDAARARKRVLYASPDGRDLGERTVVFHDASSPLPSVRWQSSDGFCLDLGIQGRTAVLRQTSSGFSERRLLPAPARAVVDAGLEILIRKAWKTLVYGRSVRFELWRGETRRFFPYELRRSGFGRWKGRPAVHFVLWPDRGDWASPPTPTRLVIDAYTRSLVRQEGPLTLPSAGLEVRSALLQVDLPLPGPLSRPDVEDE